MPRCKILVCFVPSCLIMLCLVPLATALGPEKNLPDSPPCPPATVSSAPNSFAAPTIEDVWMQHGGARLYYSALYGARQQYTGGASRIDPACSPLLPPMRAWGAPEIKKRTARKVAKPATAPCPEVVKTVSAAPSASRPAPVTTSAKGGSAAVSAVSSGASSAAQSRAEAIAKAKAASAAEAAAITKAGKAKPASAKAAAVKPTNGSLAGGAPAEGTAAVASPTSTSATGAAANPAAPVATGAAVPAPTQGPAPVGNAAQRAVAP